MGLPAYEKLGVFYLGREIDPQTQATGTELLYDSRDLTTHAVCIGMTGSGKTGLGIALLEEAALDAVPAIVIDPKGDLGNLLLTFPELQPEDFEPWVDAGEAARKGQSVPQFAAATAEAWGKGLAEWGQDGVRIRRLRAATDVAIYTPGSAAGRPLSVLRSFAAPGPALIADATALKERIAGSVSGLLGLLGIEADPLKSREHILLSAILDAAWRAGESPDLAGIIGRVQKPPFDKLGVFDLESFFPARDRTQLALSINALLAAPGFGAWLTGDPLDIQRLLYTAAGKPRTAIVSIAHLNDAERMFVVTLVLSELVAWMRRQPGTTSLRAVFYMDEIAGYFPPVAMPPSKAPLLTLMKQARAFGLGVVLATQNPVDLDYKGLSNAGTWFIGRLQTERDRERVIEGLLGTEAARGLDRGRLISLLANLSQRTFLMRNVHDDAPVLFRTRWAMSYLRGPMTLAELGTLGGAAGDAAPGPALAAGTAASHEPAAGGQATGAAASARPVVEAGVTERFRDTGSAAPAYRANVGARVRAHFVDARAGLDAWETRHYLARADGAGPDWSTAEVFEESALRLSDAPAEGASFAPAPGALLSPRAYRGWASALAEHAYRNLALQVFRCPALKRTAAPGGTEGDFRATLAHELRERRDAAVEELRGRYAKKLAALEDRQRRAEQRVERERAQATSETTSSVLSVGGSVLGALLGGRRGALAGASSAARRLGRISKERADVEHAQSDARSLREQAAAIEAELEAEIAALGARYDPAAIGIETATVRPRKSDLVVEDLALVWSA
jgi:hypothetical protein